MAQVKLAYGDQYLTVDIPEPNLIGILRPNSLPAASDVVTAVKASLAQPVGASPLAQLAAASRRITIVVDDATRPTPTKELLGPLLDELHQTNVKDDQISIICATGAHRAPSRTEWERILGEDILDRYATLSHDVTDVNSLVYLGRTSRGTPVEMNRIVVECDLRILVGIIKPHGMAGYSGGGKSLLPGVSGLDTIMADHGFQATNHPCSVLGVIEGNPIRQDIEEAAQMVGTSFIVNAILNPRHEIVAVVSGDMIQAHRYGVAILDKMVKVSVCEQADAVFCGCSRPMDINLYQASNASNAAWRLPVPAVKRGGTIVLAAQCPEGVGHSDFYELLKQAPSPSVLLRNLATANTFRRDQWAAQAWASMVDEVLVIIVSEGLTREEVENVHAVFASSLEEALDMVFERHGRSARVLVLPEAAFTIPVVRLYPLA